MLSIPWRKDDEDLFRRLERWAPGDYEGIVRAVLPRVSAVVHRVLVRDPGLHVDEAEVVAEVMFRFWKALRDANNERKPRRMAAILTTLIRCALANAQRRPTLLTVTNEVLDRRPARVPFTIDSFLERIGWWNSLLRAAGVPVAARTILVDRFFGVGSSGRDSGGSKHGRGRKRALVGRATKKVRCLLRRDPRWVEDLWYWAEIPWCPLPGEIARLLESV